MPIAKAPAATRKLVPTAAESSTGRRAGRVKLSKALAATALMKSPSPDAAAMLATPEDAKPKKPRRASGRCKISDYEYRQLTALKKRLLALGVDVKKSQLLRAGLMLLVAMDDVQLSQSVAKMEFSTVDGLPINAS